MNPIWTTRGRTTFAEIVRLTDAGQSAKALVDNLFDRMDGLEEGDPEKKALMALRRYYELCRHRAIAWQHEAAYMRSFEESEPLDGSAVEAEATATTLSGLE